MPNLNPIAYVRRLTKPISLDEDGRRQELILNILLLVSILGFIILNIIRICDYLSSPNDRGLPLIYTLAILFFFTFLLWLSRKGKLKLASWLLLIVYSLPMFYSFLAWGTDLPAALLLAVLIITLSGILINANLVLISTIALNIFLIILTYLQSEKVLTVNRYWVAEKYEVSDAIAHAILFILIASIAWLFCLGIGRALNRARRSEKALREERDSLEVRVAERTAQLRQAESEKIHQLYRLAEFGRLSSGIFHDLLNPLTAVSLNLEQIKDDSSDKVTDAKSYLGQALLATHKIEDLVAGIKKQIQKESRIMLFSPQEEINQIMQIFAYKARQAAVEVQLETSGIIKLYGDPVKFGQIISNLLANAIEASESKLNDDHKLQEAKTNLIQIGLHQTEQTMQIAVSDHGSGIAPENLGRIFEEFFSTKKENNRGLGLGLASTKSIIEKDFNGKIQVSSTLGQGACFTVIIPINLHNNEK